MASFTQNTGNDLDVQIDGRLYEAPNGVPFEVPDEFADQLRHQDIYVENTTKATPPVVTAPVVASTPDAAPAPEGN